MDAIFGYDSDSDNEHETEVKEEKSTAVNAHKEEEEEEEENEEKELQHRDKRVKLNNGKEKKKFNIVLPTLNDDLTLDSSLLPPPPPSRCYQEGRERINEQHQRFTMDVEKEPKSRTGNSQQNGADSNKPGLLVPPQIWKKKPNVTSVDA